MTERRSTAFCAVYILNQLNAGQNNVNTINVQTIGHIRRRTEIASRTDVFQTTLKHIWTDRHCSYMIQDGTDGLSTCETEQRFT